MKREILGFLTTLIFAGKFMQIIPIIHNFSYLTNFMITYWGDMLIEFSFSFLILFSYFILRGRWRFYTMALSAIGLFSMLFSLFYLDILFYTFSQILLFTSLFLLFYPLCHYEIKKYASFGYAFSLVYVLLEGTSIWRNDFYSTIFLFYLSLTLIMFIPGILKIKEKL